MHPVLIRRELRDTVSLVKAGGLVPQEAAEHCLKGLRQLKAAGEPEEWAEDSVQLTLIEALAGLAILGLWRQLRDKIIRLLGLNASEAAFFTFDPNDLVAIISAGDEFMRAVAAPRGPLTNAQVAAWVRGGHNAAANLSLSWDSDPVRQAIRDQLARIRASYAIRGLSLVRGGLGRVYSQAIVAQLAAGVFDGQNPVHVARQLRQQFGRGDYNWDRLARSEVAWAQAEGKLALLREQGIEKYNYAHSEDEKVSKICRRLAEEGPYLVADNASPLPVRDSHPQCRCSLTPVLPD